MWVSPFGNLGFTDYLHLLLAYRSSSRPSSPSSAKASTVCPYYLLFFYTLVYEKINFHIICLQINLEIMIYPLYFEKYKLID